MLLLVRWMSVCYDTAMHVQHAPLKGGVQRSKENTLVCKFVASRDALRHLNSLAPMLLSATNFSKSYDSSGKCDVTILIRVTFWSPRLDIAIGIDRSTKAERALLPDAMTRRYQHAAIRKPFAYAPTGA